MNNYLPSTMNQLSNAKNPYQGDSTKALCVCSAGLLRSPSIAAYLSSFGYNTRACGTSQEYALIPLSQALLCWADEIHVVAEQAPTIYQAINELGLKTKVWEYDIPDNYQTFDEKLMELIEKEHAKNL